MRVPSGPALQKMECPHYGSRQNRFAAVTVSNEIQRSVREIDMSSRDNEQRVLDAIENQLRTEDPQLIGCFWAFGSIAPRAAQANGPDCPAPSREVVSRGSRQRTGQQPHATATRGVLGVIGCVLAAVLGATAVWLRSSAAG
jgi:Protein of unknown function (DUF3040)